MENPTAKLRPRSPWRTPVVALALAVVAAATGRLLAPAIPEVRGPVPSIGPSGPSRPSGIPLSAYMKPVPAAGVEARARLDLARRPERVRQGFSSLPTAGEVWLGKPLGSGEGPLAWKGKSSLIHDWRGCASRDWEFLETGGGLELISETERYVRPSRGGESEPAHESVLLSYRSPALVQVTGGASYRVLYYHSLWNVANIPLELARRLGEAWGCLPLQADAEVAMLESPREPAGDAGRLPAASRFSDVELFGWDAGGRPSFALVLADRDRARIPHVAEIGVPLDRILSELARLPRASVVRWSWLSATESAGLATNPPSDLLDHISRALASTRSTLAL